MGQAAASIKNRVRSSWPFFAIVLLVLQVMGVSVSGQRDPRLAWNSAVLLLVLLIATLIAAQNALNNRNTIRLFWGFIAGGSALWAVNQVLGLVYVTGIGRTPLDPMLSASVLFLHTVLLLAALACLPHVRQLGHRPYERTLDSLLLLVFLMFVYVFFLLPGQYLNWNGTTILWSSILYFVENVALTMMAAILVITTQGFWRSVYLR